MGDVIDREGFRANVGIILMQDEGRLFIGRRSGGKGWQFPQGGVLRGEKLEDSLFRELNEEIGLGREDVASWLEGPRGADPEAYGLPGERLGLPMSPHLEELFRVQGLPGD